MAPTRIGLIAPNLPDTVAWRLALRRVVADVRSVTPSEREPLPEVALWAVVLRPGDWLLANIHWARRLSARTLLVIDDTPPALQLAHAISHPVLIGRRATAAQCLDDELALLHEMTAGIVIYEHPIIRTVPDAIPLAS